MKRKKIRVLHVLEATVGGTSKHLLSILKHTNKEEFENEIAVPRVRFSAQDDTDFFNAASELNVRIHQVEMIREPDIAHDIGNARQLFRILQSGAFDVVHAHSSKAGFLARPIAKLQRIPTIYTPNGLYFQNSRGGQRALFLNAERALALFTNRVITVSQSEYNSCVENRVVPERKLVLINNAITPLQVDKDERVSWRQELGIPECAFVVGTISRFIEQKDPHTFVQAIAQAAKLTNRELYVIWLGEGELRESTEQLAENLEMGHLFRFLGFRADAKRILNAFDVFMLSSKFEGLPYALLEAMSLGLPPIVTDVVGNRDVVSSEETGLLAQQGSPTDLAAKIVRLMNDPALLNGLGQNARDYVLNNHNVVDMVQAVERVQMEVVRSKG